jgi:hypothetical protein
MKAHIFRLSIMAFTIFRHPDVSRDPGFQHAHWLQVWVPVSAGMTEIMRFVPEWRNFSVGYQVLTDRYGGGATALEKRVPEIQELVEPGN